MKLTDQQLESIAPAIVFLEGTGMEGWEFMQDHDPNLPDLSINRHEDVTSFVFTHSDDSPMGEIHMAEFDDDQFGLTGEFDGDFDAFAQRLTDGLAHIDKVIEVAEQFERIDAAIEAAMQEGVF